MANFISSSSGELEEIINEIRSRNPNYEAYLNSRGVAKVFYMGRTQINAHYDEESKKHAGEVLATRIKERAVEKAEREQEIKNNENLLSQIARRLASGET